MNGLKCANCGFVGFPDEDCCNRCGQLLASSMPARLHQADGAAERNPRRYLTAVAVLTVLAGVVAGVMIVRAMLKADPTLAYIEALNKSPQLREQITVRMNRQELHLEFEGPRYDLNSKPGTAEKAADVLEALNLITITNETTVHTIAPAQTSISPLTGDTILVSKAFEIKNERLVILLTKKGRQEAANWRETEESVRPTLGNLAPSRNQASWWRIPIGELQVTGFDSVIERSEEIVDVVFRWRWQPNQMGENFDCAGTAVNRLPEKARNAVASIGWNSTIEYSGEARLQRSGDLWEVAYFTLKVPKPTD